MTTISLPQNKQWQGIGFVTLGICLFSLQDVIVKQISGNYPVQELVFIRSIIALGLLLATAKFNGGLGQLRTTQLRQHLLRGGVILLSYITYYLAIAAMPLANAVSLYFVSPLIVTILSIFLLKERISKQKSVALLIGFLGTLIMLRPGMGIFEPAALFAIAAAFFYAYSVIMTRRMGATESGLSLAVYATAVYLGATAIVGLFWSEGIATASTHPSIQFLARPWVLPTAYDFALLGITGLIAAIGFYALAQAYCVAEATVVAPFEYIMIPLSVIWGFLFWGDLLDGLTAVGILLIIGSGLALLPRRRWLLRRPS